MMSPKEVVTVATLKEHKRVLLTGVNGLLGYTLFESMRNDAALID
jgi:hypothetical protein